MQEEQLKTVTGSGTQSATGTPQTAGQGNVGGTRSSSLQPGTPRSVLSQSSSNAGIPLGGTEVSTIDLSPRPVQAQSSPAPSAPPPAQRDFNPFLISIPVLLVLIAAVLVWLTHRSVKNTT